VLRCATSPMESSNGAASMAALNEVQQRVLESLRQDGVASIPILELFDETTWEELTADIASFVQDCEELARGDVTQKKYLLRRFWSKKQERNHVFDLDDPWLRLFASPLVLEVVNGYRDEWTKLYYLDNWFTVPFAGASERLASQRWHRDPEDEQVVKVFLYLSDVGDGAGPFEYIRGSSGDGRYGALWPHGDGVFYPPQDEVEAAVAPEDRLTLAGPAGTVIFADTGGFHRGGFSRTEPRVSATATYVPARSLKERRFDVELPPRADLAPEVRYALDWSVPAAVT
jgi:hypothetical protein